MYLHVCNYTVRTFQAGGARNRRPHVRGQASLFGDGGVSGQPRVGWGGAAAATTGGAGGWGQDRGVGQHRGVRGGLEAVLGNGVGIQAREAGVL